MFLKNESIIQVYDLYVLGNNLSIYIYIYLKPNSDKIQLDSKLEA